MMNYTSIIFGSRIPGEAVEDAFEKLDVHGKHSVFLGMDDEQCFIVTDEVQLNADSNKAVAFEPSMMMVTDEQKVELEKVAKEISSKAEEAKWFLVATDS